MRIHIAHSPDPDDAFIFYAIARQKIPVEPFVVEHVLADIETLNQWALQGKFEITAVSLHAFAYLSERYWLLPNGGSVGKGYGPILVAKQPIPFPELSRKVIGVPGRYTTAFLLLNLAVGKFDYRIIPFDGIFDSVINGEVDAGLIIHEGQLTYPDRNLVKVLDLGEWWRRERGSSIPLGVNVVRKDIGPETAIRLSRLLEESIRYAMEHEEEALDYALPFGRGMEREPARAFIRMYVNERTLRYSPEDRLAMQTLLEEGRQRGFLPSRPGPALSFDFPGIPTSVMEKRSSTSSSFS